MTGGLKSTGGDSASLGSMYSGTIGSRNEKLSGFTAAAASNVKTTNVKLLIKIAHHHGKIPLGEDTAMAL